MSLYTRFAAGVLFPLHERLKRHDTVRLLRELEQSQWWSPQRLRELQMERLRALLSAVSSRVPFYRELFRTRALSAEMFRRHEDLALLPVTDKALIRAEGARWRSEGARDLIEQTTSGSSGEPLRFCLGRGRVSMDIAAKWRATRWWDVDIGDRELVLWASAIETGAQDRVRRWRDRLLRSRLVPVGSLDDARIDRILDEIVAFRPRMLFGYPSALARIAWRARARGLPMGEIGVRVAFTTSEVLQPEWRAVIGEVFACGVADEYGARDAGFIARQCPEGGWHITAEEMIVEILDEAGSPLPPGETGEIAITNLVGAEFPFIRYRTGDRGALDVSPCACGRGLPRLSAVAGRANDALLALDGTRVHGSAFNYLLRELSGLRAYKIVQDARDRIEVLVALDGEIPSAFARRLEQVTRTRLGEGVRLDLRRVDAIAPEANGKYRHVVCRIDQAAPALMQESGA